MCFHCDNPACIKACPHQAIYNDDKYGAVLVDTSKCTGERKCWAACPYGTPQFEKDGPGIKMSKCDMCIDRLEHGNKPICVLSCSLRALEFGLIDELHEKYGNLRYLEDLPNDSITKPAIVFKPRDSKKQIVPWEYKKALRLWQKRHPDKKDNLPDVFSEISAVTETSDGIISRNKLVLKAKSNEELMFRTMDDE